MKNLLTQHSARSYTLLFVFCIAAATGCGEMNEAGSVTIVGGETPAQVEATEPHLGGMETEEPDGRPGRMQPSPDATSVDENASGSDITGTFKEGVLAGIMIPNTAIETTKTSIEYGLHALYCASYMAGGQQLISTGTVTLNGAGARLCPINGLSFSYSASPTDRLVVKLANDQSFAVKVNDLRGNLVDGPKAFVENTHHLDVELTIVGQGEVRVISESQGQDRRLTVNGNVTLHGATYVVNLRLVGNEYFQNDSSGTEFRDHYTVTGHVEGPNTRAQVEETWDYNLVCSTTRSSSTGHRCASDARRRFSNRWVQNGVAYVLNDGFTKATFRDGRPNSDELYNGYWGAGGILTENGDPIGEVKFLPDSTGAQVGFYVVIGDEKVELQSWLTHVVRD